jgi:hypothetical protein
MQNAESILVIIVSATLTLFLLVAVIVLVLIARLVQALKRIVNDAERIVETAGEAAEMLRNASGPLALFKVVRNMVNAVDKMRK